MCQNEKNRRRIAKDKNNENRDKKPGKKKYETTIAIFCAACSEFDCSIFFVLLPTISTDSI